MVPSGMVPILGHAVGGLWRMSRFSELKAAGTDWVRFSNFPTPRVLEAGLRGRSQVRPQEGRAMVDAVVATKEANKETCGRLATIVWVISGI
jgi:hypothetical protein